LTLGRLIKTASGLGISNLEFGCGNWSSAPHLEVNALLASELARRGLLTKLSDPGLAITALNCSGNPLHPGKLGLQHRDLTLKTIASPGSWVSSV
jgi:hypothetical protein